MAYFPLFVDLEGRQVLVVGGGKIAVRRVRTLLEFGCQITVVSPEVCEELRERFSGRKNDMRRRTLKVWKMWEKLLDLYLFLQQQPRR